jgi:serine phosphatase RsbU (regulator of sigma subunit)
MADAPFDQAGDWFRYTRPGEAGLPYLRLHVVQVLVRDQDRSLRFYLDQLGFQLAVDEKTPSGERWIVVAPPSGSAGLALVSPSHTHSPAEPADVEPAERRRIGGWTGVTFITEDIDTKFEEWSRRNVHFDRPPVVPPFGSGHAKIATFSDVDGNRFSLLELDEMSRALEAERRAAAEKLEGERRAEHEMLIAKKVQAKLFPQRMPPLETLTYAGACLPAREVGGDYYDFLDLGHGRLGLAVGDIAGKGIAAALLMANLQANLRSQYAVALDDLERLLKSANRLFCENTPEASYATLFFAEYQDESRRLRYVNCGHLSPLLLRSDNSLERLESTCTVLGLFKNWDCSMAEVSLVPGDTLILYTDGVTEAMSDQGEEFGEQRFIETLRARRDLPASALLQAIVGTVQEFSGREQEDDITLVVARSV